MNTFGGGGSMQEKILYENNEENARTDTKRIYIYLISVFVLTYLYEYFFIIRFLKENPDNTIASISLRLAIAMFLPAICVFITRLITREGFKNTYLIPDLKNGKYKYYLLTWFAPPLLVFAGTVLYFLCFGSDYSADMEYIIATYAGQGVTGLTPEVMKKTAISQGITAVIIGPVINCITCFGEEWGWRGYLLPKLSRRLKFVPLMIVTGVIWGLWHVPLIIEGHNYGMDYTGYPILGIAAMILFCFSIGTLLSYATLKSGSCIPAIIGHGAVNSISAIGIFYTKSGGKLLFGPLPTGILAGLPSLIFAVILIRLMIRNEEKQK